MARDIGLFVLACFVCAISKTSNRPSAGLLQPLLVPSRPWSLISLDFVTGLPPSQGNMVVLTVVDRFSKATHFRETASALRRRDTVMVYRSVCSFLCVCVCVYVCYVFCVVLPVLATPLPNQGFHLHPISLPISGLLFHDPLSVHSHSPLFVLSSASSVICCDLRGLFPHRLDFCSHGPLLYELGHLWDYLTLLWRFPFVKPIKYFFTRNWIRVFDLVTMCTSITTEIRNVGYS